MLDNIKADLMRHLSCDARGSDALIWKIYIVFFAYGFHASTVYRFGRFIDWNLKRWFFFPLYIFLNAVYFGAKFLINKMYGISIDNQAEIGPGFYIGHFGGIEVGRCRIGRNCNIHQLVKIGDDCDIGNNVWIGAHAVIEDGVVLSNQATVMVGARVVTNVCSRCLVSGNPARIINKNYDNTQLLALK